MSLISGGLEPLLGTGQQSPGCRKQDVLRIAYFLLLNSASAYDSGYPSDASPLLSGQEIVDVFLYHELLWEKKTVATYVLGSSHVFINLLCVCHGIALKSDVGGSV